MGLKPEMLITALDIGVEELRLGVFVLTEGRALRLAGWACEPLDSGRASEMAHEARVAAALKKLLGSLPQAGRSVVVSLDGQSVFSRLVQLPPVAPDRIPQTIAHEAVQNIPFPLEEVVWDSHLFEPVDGVHDVLLAAVKADSLSGLVSAVAANGLEVESIGVAPVLLANAVRFNYPECNQPLLLVDRGVQTVSLVFMDGDRTFFRTLPVGADSTERLLQELGRSVTFYVSQQSGRRPEQILLAGEPTGGEALGAALEEQFKVPVEPFDPLRKIPAESGVPAAQSCGLGVLSGLAVTQLQADSLRLNLVPQELVQARSARKQRPVIVASVFLAALIAWVWVIALLRSGSAASRAALQIRAEVSALQAIEANMIPLERRLSNLKRRAAVYRRLAGQRVFWLDALDELRQRLPEGMFLLSSEPIRVEQRITGIRINVLSYLDKETEGSDAVVELRERLRASPLFSQSSRIFRRPSKNQFARRFVIDVLFEEALAE